MRSDEQKQLSDLFDWIYDEYGVEPSEIQCVAVGALDLTTRKLPKPTGRPVGVHPLEWTDQKDGSAIAMVGPFAIRTERYHDGFVAVVLGLIVGYESNPDEAKNAAETYWRYYVRKFAYTLPEGV